MDPQQAADAWLKELEYRQSQEEINTVDIQEIMDWYDVIHPQAICLLL